MIELNNSELLRISGGFISYSALYCRGDQVNKNATFFMGMKNSDQCQKPRQLCKDAGYLNGFCKKYGYLNDEVMQQLNLVYTTLHETEEIKKLFHHQFHQNDDQL